LLGLDGGLVYPQVTAPLTKNMTQHLSDLGLNKYRQRDATPEEYESMCDLHKGWYDNDTVPIMLMKDGTIQGQSLSGAFGGSQHAFCWLKKGSTE